MARSTLEDESTKHLARLSTFSSFDSLIKFNVEALRIHAPHHSDSDSETDTPHCSKSDCAVCSHTTPDTAPVQVTGAMTISIFGGLGDNSSKSIRDDRVQRSMQNLPQAHSVREAEGKM